jgi:hypothetical protein
MVAPRKAAFAEESAEVEVLFANVDKLKNLTKKIQGSLHRLETGGKSVQDAIGPIYGNTQRLQVTNSSMLLGTTFIDVQMLKGMLRHRPHNRSNRPSKRTIG